jgi:hypothetical protein
MGGSMKRAWLIAAVLMVLGFVGASCTAAQGPPDYLPTTPLGGFTKIARTNGSACTGTAFCAAVVASPNTRYVAYLTDETIPPDVDPLPGDRNLYLLDRTTGDHHLVSPGFGEDAPYPYTTFSVSDDGAVLVMSPTTDPSVYTYALYTIGTGLVPLVVPTDVTGCRRPQFEAGGHGLQMLCNGSDTQPLGLFRFDAGDVTATPVAVVSGLAADRRQAVTISPNHRYFLVGDPTYQCNFLLETCLPNNEWVYDAQTATLLPFPYSNTDLGSLQFLFVNVRTTYGEGPDYLGNDGRIRFHNEGFSATLDAEQEMWFDPNTGRFTQMDGFPPLYTLTDVPGSNYFLYDDFTREIGHNYRLERRTPSVLTILGDFASPSTRFTLPYDNVVKVSSAGDVLILSNATTQPGDLEPGVDILVRNGPLPG